MSRCHVRKCGRKDVNPATKVLAARSVADTTSRIASAAVNNDTNVLTSFTDLHAVAEPEWMIAAQCAYLAKGP
jgi:hypothetical protein